MKNLKFKNVTIYVMGANGEVFEYHHNNEYKNKSKQDIIDMFDLELLHYASELEGNEFKESFNTYNWGAPITFCGVYSGDAYNGVGLVNIHLGGDPRGNYSEPYICNDLEAVFSQSTYLSIELTNGETFTFDCDNGEGYFNFDTFDPYWVDFDTEITKECYNELKDKNND